MKTLLISFLAGVGIVAGTAITPTPVIAQTPMTPAPDDATQVEPEDLPAPALVIMDAADVDLESFQWEFRIVAVMANTPNDPAFQQQLRFIEEEAEELQLRDVIVLVDSDRRSNSALRRLLRPRGFMLAFIGKDGEIKGRRPAPRDVREISAIIDRFPLRRQEMLQRRPAGR